MPPERPPPRKHVEVNGEIPPQGYPPLDSSEVSTPQHGSVSVGTVPKEIKVALLDAAVVSGVILDARNEPAFGADVQPVFWLEAPVSGPVAPPVDRRIQEMSYYGRDRTGLDGTFYLDNLDPGRPFQVEAKAGDGRIGRSDLIVLEPGEMRSGLRIVIR